MKIDRLLGILTILQQCDQITAPELAERFEVSRRTIYRDIDDICKAGIPIVTTQGGNGGISIAEGYKLKDDVLTTEELQNIISGLKSIGSVTDSVKIDNLISKLTPKKDSAFLVDDTVLIDLASHYKSSLSQKISIIRKGITERKLVKFDYYSEKGHSSRLIEPYFITFKWAAWYVYGYCRERNGFRLFKLNRLWQCEMLDEKFIARDLIGDAENLDDYLVDDKKIVILFDTSLEYRLIEEYGPSCYEVISDGALRFSMNYTNKEFMIGWVLSFGDKAKVIEPSELAIEISTIARRIVQKYEHDI